jgi:hypothetical protein
VNRVSIRAAGSVAVFAALASSDRIGFGCCLRPDGGQLKAYICRGRIQRQRLFESLFRAWEVAEDRQNGAEVLPPPKPSGEEAHLDVSNTGQVNVQFVTDLHEQLTLALTERGWKKMPLSTGWTGACRMVVGAISRAFR